MKEEAILNAAATIFAGLYASGRVNRHNDRGAMKDSFETAQRFAQAAEQNDMQGIAKAAEGEVPFP